LMRVTVFVLDWRRGFADRLAALAVFGFALALANAGASRGDDLLEDVSTAVIGDGVPVLQCVEKCKLVLERVFHDLAHVALDGRRVGGCFKQFQFKSFNVRVVEWQENTSLVSLKRGAVVGRCWKGISGCGY
jgi:hypothetical protein